MLPNGTTTSAVWHWVASVLENRWFNMYTSRVSLHPSTCNIICWNIRNSRCCCTHKMLGNYKFVVNKLITHMAHWSAILQQQLYTWRLYVMGTRSWSWSVAWHPLLMVCVLRVYFRGREMGMWRWSSKSNASWSPHLRESGSGSTPTNLTGARRVDMGNRLPSWWAQVNNDSTL